jgi:hypothetical protein
MGFSFIRLDGARILDNSVVVRIVATDDESEDPPGAENLRVSVPPRGRPRRFLTRR